MKQPVNKNIFQTYDYIAQGTFVLDRTFRVVFWNRSLELQTGFNRENVLNKRIFDLYPHLKARKYVNRINSIFAGGVPAVFSPQLHKYFIPCKLPDQQYRVQHTIVTPFSDGDGSYYAVFSILDVTEEKKLIDSEKELKNHALQEVQERLVAEKKLRQSEADLKASQERLNLAVLGADIGLWDWNITDDYLYFNDNLAYLLDYSPGTLDYSISAFKGLCHPGFFKQVNKAFAEHHGEKTDLLKIDLKLKSNKGQWKWMQITGKITARNSSGKPIRISGILQDISEVKSYQRQLIQEKDKAEQASVAKAQFLSAMSHEIRTPMNAVIGMTHYLLQEKPRKDQVENLNALKFSAENLLALINDILDFSKIEAGKVTIEKIEFNLDQLLKGLYQSFLLKAREKNIELLFELDQQLPRVMVGDRVKLIQILSNLISNAIKFTETGEVQVKVAQAATKTVPDSPTSTIPVCFEVKDTGIGIAPNKLQTIFESFTQGSSETTRVYGGTGLGLTISRHLLEIQQSEIHVDSVEGEGSRFYFTLHFRVADSTPAASLTPGKQQEPPQENLGGVSILLVEDNQMNIMVAKRFLKKWGARIDTAGNGAEAVEKVQQARYDIILMDIQMPVMDGYEATRNIRKLKGNQYQKLPIVALTASALIDKKDVALEAGMNDFLTKPFVPERLFSVIYSLTTQALTGTT
jgi:PAS domain S-box-containing protein